MIASQQLLAIDIGNTQISCGVIEDSKLISEFRLGSDIDRTFDEYASLIKIMLADHANSKLAVVICSVVPPLTPIFEKISERLLHTAPVIIGPGVKTGMAIRLSDPSGVGADRIANAVAAKEFFGCPSIVVDFGTATTFDVIGPAGDYIGGIISPGLNSSVQSLVDRTAKLPRIELQAPDKVIGKNTVQAMQSGAVWGYVCLVDGLIQKIIEELEINDFNRKNVISTGGLGRLITPLSKNISSYDPHLTLKGMEIIYTRVKASENKEK